MNTMQRENGLCMDSEVCRLGDCNTPPIPCVIEFDYTCRVFYSQHYKLVFAQEEMAHMGQSAVFFVHT
jgi:hypothetical protein